MASIACHTASCATIPQNLPRGSWSTPLPANLLGLSRILVAMRHDRGQLFRAGRGPFPVPLLTLRFAARVRCSPEPLVELKVDLQRGLSHLLNTIQRPRCSAIYIIPHRCANTALLADMLQLHTQSHSATYLIDAVMTIGSLPNRRSTVLVTLPEE